MPRLITPRRTLLISAGLILALIPFAGCTSTNGDEHAAQPQNEAARDGKMVEQLSFNSPEEAMAALHNVAATGDRDYARQLFGPEADDLSSDDPERDARERAFFVRKLLERSELRLNADGSRTIIAGREGVEFPVPVIAAAGGRWMFDTQAGVERLTDMRIGHNELRTIAFLRALPRYQREFRAINPEAGEYARRLISSPGRHDGLYWQAKEGEPASPLGPVAASGDYDYDEAQGYNGYFFKLLLSQGPGAAGGARSYEANGKLTGGFAVLAFPSAYEETGIKCFLVNQDGVVYEKDLGDQTPRAPELVTSYDPTDGWQRTDD